MRIWPPGPHRGVAGGRSRARSSPASDENGVLTLRIPVSEQAKPRKIAIGSGGNGRKQINS
jgi:hypothetical protein